MSRVCEGRLKTTQDRRSAGRAEVANVPEIHTLHQTGGDPSLHHEGTQESCALALQVLPRVGPARELGEIAHDRAKDEAAAHHPDNRADDLIDRARRDVSVTDCESCAAPR